MARSPGLPRIVRQNVAAQAAHALATIVGHVSGSEVHAHTTLHESLPVWVIATEDFIRLRQENSGAKPDIREYIQKTSTWLHLLYRNDKPYGYVHGRQRPKGNHKVTNVSITVEAQLIRQAIDELDRVSEDDAARAGICECPKAGLAAVIALPKRVKEEPLICVFRDPEVTGDWSPSRPITSGDLIGRLRQLHVVSGPSFRR
jgi:hypothetical protein